MSLGSRGESSVRSLIRDVSVPGFVAGERLRQWRADLDMTRWPWTQERTRVAVSARTERHDDAALAELRRLRFELAQQREKLAGFQDSLGPIHASAQSAHGVKRISTRVLLPESRFSQAGGIVLSAGATAGIDSNRLAVEEVVLNAGGEGIPRRATVLAGATVVGKTAEIGAWTSTLLAVYDPQFRAHVRLVRQGTAGTVMGEQGVLEGDGSSGCLVKYVPSNVAVEVGDHVYSFDPTGRIPQPLYYGQVDRAELRPEAPHWDIHVRPAVDLAKLSEVQVLIEDSPIPELAVDQ
jgi:cell shape-determining protein MreC